VEYLKAQYIQMGIPAAQGGENYFQDVPLEVGQIPEGEVILNGDRYDLGVDFLTFQSIKASFAQIVYVGYGIEDPAYSDYDGLDVKGKLVLVKMGEPTAENGQYAISGNGEKSIWSNMSESLGKRIEIAAEKGAAGLIYYDPINYDRFKARFDWMKEKDNGSMQLKIDQENQFFNLYIDTELAKAIYPDIVIDENRKTIDLKMELAIESQNNGITSENVVAVLKGSEIPNEYVVISSNLDHIGITSDGQINNGADDDGSGTVALLEIARAFKSAAAEGRGPKRSIVFLHVTGEEKGLLGSQYYTDVDPIFPLDQTVANLNIDMIGRIDPKRKGSRNYVYLIGSDKLSSELHWLSEEVNAKYAHLELDYTFNDDNDPNRFFYRSDHYNFAKNNVPIIFYFNGTHDDYHRPGDTPDKINYDLLQNRARLIFLTAWEVANRNTRLKVDKATK
ncbi:MAG: M28 family peptidase, partial [Flavobacteriales bacterium]